MKLLLDQGLPRSAGRMLREAVRGAALNRRRLVAKTVSRRTLLAGAAAAGALTILHHSARAEADARAAPAAGAGAVPGLPLVDYHVHLDNLGLEKALEISLARGVKFGIVEHAGTKENQYPVVLSGDDDLKRHIAMLEGKAAFTGIQAEFTDWMGCFSKDVVARLDYVLTDALTFPEKDGTRVELWKTEKVHIPDKQDFMERYVAHNVNVITAEPIDILASPTYLPKVLQDEFDALWTPERMRRIIDAAVRCRVAIEINAGARLPRIAFLRLAKEAGARFSFGSNIRGPNVGKLDYSLEMAKELGLKPEDLFTPAPPGRKPIQVRQFA
jgi:histidinol phosphatase-like PHP family hydrolase